MIRYVDLEAQYGLVAREIEEAVLRVLRSGRYVLGPEVEAFEEEFASYSGGARFGIAVNSGTSALHLALLAAGAGPGDEVITSPFTFVATVAAVAYTGARPLLADIDPASFTLHPGNLERFLTPRTKAIIPVHLFGQPCEMEPILAIARRHNLVVIEDAAQAHGAEYRGRRVGTLGHLACFSFYPTKNLGACGEGGIVLTNDPALARTVRSLRDWGQTGKYQYAQRGFNYRMEAVQAAVLRVKLRHLEEWTETRRALAALYDDLLAGSGAVTPHVRPDVRHVYHVYAIRSSQRSGLQSRLRERGIETAIHYPEPIHLIGPWSNLGYRRGDFPAAESAAGEVLSLPLHPSLTEAEVRQVSDAVRA